MSRREGEKLSGGETESEFEPDEWAAGFSAEAIVPLGRWSAFSDKEALQLWCELDRAGGVDHFDDVFDVPFDEDSGSCLPLLGGRPRAEVADLWLGEASGASAVVAKWAHPSVDQWPAAYAGDPDFKAVWNNGKGAPEQGFRAVHNLLYKVEKLSGKKRESWRKADVERWRLCVPNVGSARADYLG